MFLFTKATCRSPQISHHLSFCNSILIFLQVVCFFLEYFNECENNLSFRGLVQHFHTALMLQIYSQNCLGCWVFTKHHPNNLIFFSWGVFSNVLQGRKEVQFKAESESVSLETYAAGTKLFCIIQAVCWHVCSDTMWHLTDRLNCKQGVSHIWVTAH